MHCVRCLDDWIGQAVSRTCDPVIGTSSRGVVKAFERVEDRDVSNEFENNQGFTQSSESFDGASE